MNPERIDKPLSEVKRRVAIVQSNYIPWKGYFDIIHDVDLFIYLDNVQYTPRDGATVTRLKRHKALNGLRHLPTERESAELTKSS
jgi:hypothetical protein